MGSIFRILPLTDSAVVMLHVRYIQGSVPGCLLAALKTTKIVIAMPVTYTNLFATTVVDIFSIIIPITGGYLEKAHFSFTLFFCSVLVLGLKQESLGIWPESNLI